MKISPGDGVKTWHAKYIRIHIEGIRGLSHQIPPSISQIWTTRALAGPGWRPGVAPPPQVGPSPHLRGVRQTQSHASHAIYRASADISRVRQNICTVVYENILASPRQWRITTVCGRLLPPLTQICNQPHEIPCGGFRSCFLLQLWLHQQLVGLVPQGCPVPLPLLLPYLLLPRLSSPLPHHSGYLDACPYHLGSCDACSHHLTPHGSLTSITRKAWESGPNGQGIEAARAHAFLDCAARCACLHKNPSWSPEF